MSILEARNLTKTFGTFTAVDEISFELKEGEILGFLGTNGAGKTTTLQMLLGVLSPTAGTISYFKKNFQTHREEILEQVNFSSTYTSLPGNLTVNESLTFMSYLYTIPKRRKRVQEVIELFQLGSLASQKVATLSAGQQTRLNLAKAFLNRPRVLLLDEPTASLDPDIAENVRTLLREEQRNQSISTIITSHNMGEVESICDRVIFLHQGKIVANDTPSQLAKSMDTCRVELLIEGNLKTLKDLLKQKKYRSNISGRRATIEVPEKEVAHLLHALNAAGITYTEISIEKPTLEDYFLHVVEKKTL